MTLKKLKELVDYYIGTGHLHGDEEVLITLDEPSVGCRAYESIDYAGCGIDWEANQFRLEPTEKLCHRGRSRDDAMEIRVRKYIYDNSTQFIRRCPSCESKLKKGDRYCYYCGQNVSNGERIVYERDYRSR